MPTPEEALARIDGLIRVALGLALSTASGRIVLAKAAANLDPAWIPTPLRANVVSALEQAVASRPPPLSPADVERILTRAWGVGRLSDELDSLEPEPVAVTFTSQVHRGVHAGSGVAVKVLRPGVATALRQDLTLFEALAASLGAVLPGLNPAALLAEARERGLDELDLAHEAGLMRRVQRALRGADVVIPRPVTELCRETVLVSSWLEGRSLAVELRRGDPPSDATAAALIQFVLGGLGEGLVPCDIDAEDVLILADGRIGVVDFGAVTVFEGARADLALATLDAFIAEDPPALDAGLVALGVLEPGHGPSAQAVLNAALGPLAGGQASRLDVAAVAAGLRRLEGFETETVELMAAARLSPGDLYPARGIAQLISLVARLGASGVWRDQVRAALAEGWH